jgi:hypothetical protein
MFSTQEHFRPEFMGGGVPVCDTVKGKFLSLFCTKDYDVDGHLDSTFRFIQYATLVDAAVLCDLDNSLFPVPLPLCHILRWLTREELRTMATLHGLRFTMKLRKPELAALFSNHHCNVCDLHVSLFRCQDVLATIRNRNNNYKTKSRLKLNRSDDSSTCVGIPKEPLRSRSLRMLDSSSLRPYIIEGYKLHGPEESNLQFVSHVPLAQAISLCIHNSSFIPFNLPIEHLSTCLTRQELRETAASHNIPYRSDDRKLALKLLFKDHICDSCDQYASVFSSGDVEGFRYPSDVGSSKFPPNPPTPSQVEQIVNAFCADTTPASFEESGCTICGRLTLCTELIPVKDCGCDLSLLNAPGVTRKERFASDDPLEELAGPVIDDSCSNVCPTCSNSLRKRKVPKHALANGIWLGKIPDVLKDLTFAEKMMIARVRHNRAVVRVSSGRAKMVANVIMFSNPTLSVYRMLPPSRDEMKEVLAFIFTGSAQPTDEDFKRTPLLVRRDKVSKALDWLKLNHSDYKDLEISKENLESYPLSGVPVVVDFKKMCPAESNKLPAAMSTHDMEEEDGTETGICPFAVHGITGDEYTKLSMTQLKARALKHLHDQGKVLGIGHEEKPQSMYDNPQAYPQMFPWLFPYGHGGIGQACHRKRMSEAETQKAFVDVP